MIVIEVFADVGCPFTHVGLRRLVERRRERGLDDAVVLRVRAWPLELVNGRPLDPPFIADEVDELRIQVAPDLFTGFDATQFPATSLPAMALAARAYETGDRLGEAVSLALRDAIFEQGRDVADPQVLAAVAAEHGLAPGPGGEQAVLADWEDGKRRGVIGSPHFFGRHGDAFCPSLDIKRVEGHLQISADPASMEALLDDLLSD